MPRSYIEAGLHVLQLVWYVQVINEMGATRFDVAVTGDFCFLVLFPSLFRRI